MYIHVILVLFAKPLIIAEMFAGCSLLPTIIIYLMAHVSRFCWVHKGLILYTALIDGRITYNRYFEFTSKEIYEWEAFIVGTFLIFYTIIFKFIWKKSLG